MSVLSPIERSAFKMLLERRDVCAALLPEGANVAFKNLQIKGFADYDGMFYTPIVRDADYIMRVIEGAE